MNAILVLLYLLSLIVSVAALAIAWKIWQKLRDVHARLHRLEKFHQVLEANLGVLSRVATQTAASQALDMPFSQITCNAQHGEELFIWQLLGFQSSGVFIEIGAYDGRSLSNSLFFESIGWRTILVEAHPELAEQCRSNRPDATIVHAALGATDGESVEFSMVRGSTGMDTLSFLGASPEHEARILSRGGRIDKTTVPGRTLLSVLQEHEIQAVDCMSVDVEGAELEVLKVAGLDTIKPKIILVEDNSDGADREVPDLLSSFGYSRTGTVGCNCIYLYTKN